MAKNKGPLIVIGGGEEREETKTCCILREVAKHALPKHDRLVIVTVATNFPQEVGAAYRKIFKFIGVNNLDVLDIRTREQAFDKKNVQKLHKARVIFFSGGDQLRITSQIGGTPLFQEMLDLHNAGGVIAGTSAGAAAVPETMLISGPGASIKVSALGMAPGLGLLKGVVVDSHFAERGRLGRLIGAVAQNPHNLGLGIDEDTAIVIENDERFHVLGSGAVYALDGTHVTYSSLSEEDPEGILSVHDLTLHTLAHDDGFDLKRRHPLAEHER